MKQVENHIFNLRALISPGWTYSELPKIQKWGGSSALRLPVEALAAAGISGNAEVEIQADNGRLVIREQRVSGQAEKRLLNSELSHGQTEEDEFEKLLAREPGAAKLLAEVKDSLAEAIKLTDETTARCRSLIRKMETLT